MENRGGYGRLRLDGGHHARIMAAALLLGVGAFLPVGLRLYGLMIADHGYYSALALKNQSRTTPVYGERGTIYDRNMNILACSQSREDVYLNPNELARYKSETENLCRFLGAVLGKDPAWLRQQAEDVRYRYKRIASNISPETASEIRSFVLDAGIQGVHLEPTQRRLYPYNTLAAQVLGFVNASGEGCEGLEAAYDTFLSGERGRVIAMKGNREIDMPFAFERYAAARQGADLILTLDVTVQECLEKHLLAAIDRYGVKNGAFGLVMNCKTGELLAMATIGAFDPNDYQTVADPRTAALLAQMEESYERYPAGSPEYDRGKADYTQALYQAQLKQWRNRVISDGYEPGSTFKVLTMAAALDSGAIDLETPFYCRGAEQIPGRAQLLHCWRSAGHGAEKTPQALQNSCNIAFAHIALKMGGEVFYDYIQRFGILEKTGIDLNGESKGVFFDRALVTNTDKWGTASLTSGSFGQTFKITPLQLVRAISAVVNGGVLIEPYLVAEVLDAQGEPLLRQESQPVRRVIREETSAAMRTLLRSVVTEGTAKNAAVAGFSIGGKTGTSEKIDVFDDQGQRVQDKIVSFVGVAPMDDPEYIVLAALDTPGRETGIYISGGVMAAPTVGGILADILPYLGVSPETAPVWVTVPELAGMEGKEATALLQTQGLEGVAIGTGDAVVTQLPRAGESLLSGSQVLVYFQEPDARRETAVPELTGKSRAEAAAALGAIGLRMRATGTDAQSPATMVTMQSIPPGTLVSVGEEIELQFTDTSARD